jgi:DNA-directed RNA polymerase specialized sigma subunit
MEEDIYLIDKVKKYKDESSIKELINRHSGIYVEMVNKYIPASNEGLNKEDILQDKDFCIYDAAIKYDECKNTKFSTFVGNLARWKCLNIYNKNIKFPQETLDSDKKITFEPKSFYDEISKIEEKEDLTRVYKAIKNIKDPRVEKIFKMRYKNVKKLTPWKKIAKKLDLSIQGCINIHNKHLTEIKKYV